MWRIVGIIAVCVLAYLALGFLISQWNYADRKQTLREFENLSERLNASPNDPDAVAEFRSRLESSYAFERRQAFGYVGDHLGEASLHYLEEIRAGVSDSDPYVRRGAAQAPGEIGPAARDLVPELIATARAYPDTDAGWFAVESLAEIAAPGDERLLGTLEELTRSSSERMREWAARALETYQADQSATQPTTQRATRLSGLLRNRRVVGWGAGSTRHNITSKPPATIEWE